ncbi:F-box protein [Morus notabilis]|uniref:F-box protein n=1 Tax=Morus notabilis TaxID=981085 RepID=W9R8S7_9ROSA|nr:F-box protein [Morus notabilis]
MATLPWDIIVDVLSRLSVKDLLRYKSVSKPWCSLIDGQDFIKMHLKNSMETGSNLGVVLRDCDLHWVDLESLDSAVKLQHPIGGDRHGTEVLGSCHGLLVLLNINDVVALWNPSTRRYRKIPISNIEFPDGILPCFQFIVYGFGYDPVSNDYKLVRMVQFFGNVGEDSFDSEVKVYSAKSNTWKRIRDFPYYLRYKHGFGVLSNNALHWVVSRKPLSDVSNLVFAVDLVTEEYREVPLPEFEGESFHMNVEVLGGSLCLLCNYVSDDPNADWGSGSDHVDMWMMKEYGVRESWTKFCTVVPSDGIGPFNYVLPIAYLKSGNQVLMNKNGEKFVVYDLESKKAWDKKISGVPHHLETCLCVGSLVRLDGDNEPFGWKLGGEDKKKKKKKKKKNKKKKNKKQSKKKQR